MRRRIVFSLLMGVVTTGLISFVLVAINVGLAPGFTRVWLRSWSIAYVVVIPVILLLSPRLQALVDRVVP